MRCLVALLVLSSAAPAFAAETPVSEPSSLALVALGVLGVIVGRQGSRRKRD